MFVSDQHTGSNIFITMAHLKVLICLVIATQPVYGNSLFLIEFFMLFFLNNQFNSDLRNNIYASVYQIFLTQGLPLFIFYVLV